MLLNEAAFGNNQLVPAGGASTATAPAGSRTIASGFKQLLKSLLRLLSESAPAEDEAAEVEPASSLEFRPKSEPELYPMRGITIQDLHRIRLREGRDPNPFLTRNPTSRTHPTGMSWPIKRLYGD